MVLFFNVLLAWLAVVLGVLLSIIWLTKILQKNMQEGHNKDLLIKVNKFLRKNHINLGYLFIISSFIHGILSSFSIISFNYGTVALMIGLVLWYTFVEKKSIGKGWIKRHRELTVWVIIVTVLHVFEVGGVVGIDRVVNSIKSDLNLKANTNNVNVSNNYEDGLYEGIGYGFRPDLKVQVSIKNGLIDKISIVSHNEVGEMFYKPAFDYIPKEIIDKQTPNIDVLSGSTYSSTGIMEAVEDALSKARK